MTARLLINHANKISIVAINIDELVVYPVLMSPHAPH